MESGIDERKAKRQRIGLPLLGACLLAALLLSPALFAGFYGDDFELWYVGQQTLENPSSFFIGPGNFYRPANSWLFAGHHLLFGTDPLGYHVGTLLMQLACGAMLGAVVARFSMARWGVFATALFWMCSPYAFEPVQYVNVAYNDLTVLLAWLGLAVLWPGPGVPWNRGRIAGAAALVTFSLFCKESWVIVPGLVAAFERFLAGASWKRVFRTTALVTVPVAVYTVAYPFIFPGRQNYYDFGLWAVAKVFHLWSCFAMLTELNPNQPTMGAMEVVGGLLLAAVVFVGVARRSPLIGLGLAFYACSLVPVLFVPFIPTRYTTVPLVGFVLAMAGVGLEVVRWTPEPRRRWAVRAVAATAAVGFAACIAWLTGDFEDMKRLRQPYTELVDEARAFAPHLPTDRPLVCVRMEANNPLERLNASGALGVPKLFFQRPATPYGLAEWAQLFSYARAGHGRELFADLRPGEAGERGGHVVVGHIDGQFVFVEPRADNADDELDWWRGEGYPARLIGPWKRPG